LKSEVDPAQIRLLSASSQRPGRALTNGASIRAGNTFRTMATGLATLDTETVAKLSLIPPRTADHQRDRPAIVMGKRLEFENGEAP